jgi:uncharacterized membrane protein YbaN (DUF454 family)
MEREPIARRETRREIPFIIPEKVFVRNSRRLKERLLLAAIFRQIHRQWRENASICWHAAAFI